METMSLKTKNKELKSFMGFEFWKTIKVMRCYGMDYYKEPISFKEWSEAKQYAEKLAGIGRNNWIRYYKVN